MDTAFAPAVMTAGLDNPTYDSIKVFRAVANAMSHPGAIQAVDARPPAPVQLAPACAALCLALLDGDTPLWMQHHQPLVKEYLRFHCGCPITPHSRSASFALITSTSALPELGVFNAGCAEYPDESATLLIQVQHLSNAGGVTLRGPGLREPCRLEVGGMPADYWRAIQESRAQFPLGVDIVFVWGKHIAALPRSTQITV